jgi:hypothetical protein
MTKSNSKTTTTANKRKHPTKANKNSKPALLKVFLWGYAPTGFTKQHLVAIIGGAFVGGFLAGMTIGGPGAGRPWWPTILYVLIGSAIGAFFTLALVPNSKQK